MMREQDGYPSAEPSSGSDPASSGWLLAFIPTTTESPQGTTYGQITDVVYQPSRPSRAIGTYSPPASQQPPLKSYQPYDMTGANPYRPAPAHRHHVQETYKPPPPQRPGLKSYQPFDMTGGDTYHPLPPRPHQAVRLPSYKERYEDVYAADKHAASSPTATSSQFITLSSPTSPPAPTPSYPPSDLRGEADWKEYYDDQLVDRHPCAQSRSFKILEAALEVQGSGAPGLPDPRIAAAEERRRERRRVPQEALAYSPQEPSYHSQEPSHHQQPTAAYQPQEVHVHASGAQVASIELPIAETTHDATAHVPVHGQVQEAAAVQGQVQQPVHPPAHDVPAQAPEVASTGTLQETPAGVAKEAPTAVIQEAPVAVPPPEAAPQQHADAVNPQQQQQQPQPKNVPTDF